MRAEYPDAKPLSKPFSDGPHHFVGPTLLLQLRKAVVVVGPLLPGERCRGTGRSGDNIGTSGSHGDWAFALKRSETLRPSAGKAGTAPGPRYGRSFDDERASIGSFCSAVVLAAAMALGVDCGSTMGTMACARGRGGQCRRIATPARVPAARLALPALPRGAAARGAARGSWRRQGGSGRELWRRGDRRKRRQLGSRRSGGSRWRGRREGRSRARFQARHLSRYVRWLRGHVHRCGLLSGRQRRKPRGSASIVGARAPLRYKRST